MPLSVPTYTLTAINRAMKTAENTGLTCSFMHVHERAERTGGRARLDWHLDRMAENTGTTCLFRHVAKNGTGGRARLNYHLDRMAAYLVAMNGDPVVESAELAREVANAVATTPAATPDLVTGQTKALSPTLDNAPILHITPLNCTNSTF